MADGGECLVKTTYKLEGDGPLVLDEIVNTIIGCHISQMLMKLPLSWQPRGSAAMGGICLRVFETWL